MKRLSACLCALLFFATAALAQDNEEDFEDAVRNFGYTSGLAHQCTPKVEKITLEKEVVKAYTGIVSLFGSDEAFFYAAAFGAGSTAQYDNSKCREYVDAFNAHLQRAKGKK